MTRIVTTREAIHAVRARGDVRRSVRETLARYQGHLELCSSNGTVSSVTPFDTDQNAHAAEQTFDEEIPGELAEFFGERRRVSVDRYDVLAESLL